MAFYDVSRDAKQDQTPTAIEVTYPCWIGGEQRAIGDLLTIGKQDAVDLAQMGRAVIIGKAFSTD